MCGISCFWEYTGRYILAVTGIGVCARRVALMGVLADDGEIIPSETQNLPNTPCTRDMDEQHPRA